MIKIALNGGTLKSENPNVPATVEEYAAELKWFLERDESNFHIHFRDDNGYDTLEQSFVQPQWEALKKQFPDAKIGVGSPLLYGRTSEIRLDQIGRWDGFKPDYISVNVPEEGCRQLVDLCREKEIKMEISCFTIEDAYTFVEEDYAKDSYRVLIEVSGEADGPATVKKAMDIYDHLHPRYPDLQYVIHGEDIFTWDVIAHCKANGLDWRIGMEDIACDRDGKPIATNHELYEYAMNDK